MVPKDTERCTSVPALEEMGAGGRTKGDEMQHPSKTPPYSHYSGSGKGSATNIMASLGGPYSGK